MEGRHPSRHIGQHGWTTAELSQGTDWDEVADLVDSAYRHVALERMLRALED